MFNEKKPSFDVLSEISRKIDLDSKKLRETLDFLGSSTNYTFLKAESDSSNFTFSNINPLGKLIVDVSENKGALNEVAKKLSEISEMPEMIDFPPFLLNPPKIENSVQYDREKRIKASEATLESVEIQRETKRVTKEMARHLLALSKTESKVIGVLKDIRTHQFEVDKKSNVRFEESEIQSDKKFRHQRIVNLVLIALGILALFIK
jgi:hypothetical protein